MDIKSLLLKKYGPAPVWVYFGVFILGVAWFVKRRNDSAPSSDQSASSNDMPQGQPMNYSSDIFVNVPSPVTPTPPAPPHTGGTPTTAPLPTRPTKPPIVLPPGQSSTPRPPVRKKSVTYVVKKGDTLWDIAARTLHSGSNYPQIYQANKTTIETAARQHGFTSSGNGSRIWAGEKLVIPNG